MNLDRLNQWLILAANLGVLTGIIFLSIEIRQNTLAIRGTAIQTAAALSREQMFVIAQNTELSRIAVMANDPAYDLTPVEAFRFSYLVRTFWSVCKPIIGNGYWESCQRRNGLTTAAQYV